jgi:hypothetical protein
MRKAVLYLLLVIFLASCGPRRMKCGPGRRCLVDAPKEKMIVNAIIYQANKIKFNNFLLNVDAGRNSQSTFTDFFVNNKKAVFSIALGVGIVVAAPVLGGATAVAAGVLGVLLAKKGCESAYRANKDLIDNVYNDITVKVNGFFGLNNRANENIVLFDNVAKQLTFEVSRRKIIASDESKTTPLAIDYFESYRMYNEFAGETNLNIQNLKLANYKFVEDYWKSFI